ncbi:MAG: CdaR family protein [Oscillospiraceae bacterium]
MKFKDGKSPFENRVFKVIFSIAMAIVCWMAVVFTISTESKVTITDVPVTINTSSAAFQSLGLDIIDKNEITVNVRVEGPRTVVGALDKNSVKVTPSFASVKEVGVYELPLTATKSNQLENFTIVSVDPITVKLRFDNATSKKFPVSVNVIGLETSEEFIVETPVSNPPEVTITGPELDVNNIAKVVADCTVNAEVSETVTQSCALTLLDADGNAITSSTLKIDNETVDVSVPVYKRGVVPIDIEFSNVPEGFDISTLKYVMSIKELDIAASAKVIDNLKTKIVGYVDLAAFEIGESYTFDIDFPTGVVNLDNIEQVTVSFPKENIASKKVNVSDIRVQNAPANMKVTVKNTRINDVTVIGATDDVLGLLSGSVIAIVDVSQLSVEKGSYNVPVKFTVTANNTTFVSGSYTVLIEVEPN